MVSSPSLAAPLQGTNSLTSLRTAHTFAKRLLAFGTTELSEVIMAECFVEIRKGGFGCMDLLVVKFRTEGLGG